MDMIGPFTYVIERIEGEYAYLKRTDASGIEEPMMVAVALLPAGVDVGSALLWKDLQYSFL